MKNIFEHIAKGEVAQFQKLIKEEVDTRISKRLEEIKRDVIAEVLGLEIEEEKEAA